MESVYASLLLHKAGQKLNEENLEKVLEAAGAKVDKTKVKATLAALEGINIDEALKSAAFTAVAAPEGAGAGKKEDKKKEEEKKEEETVAGLSALFG